MRFKVIERIFNPWTKWQVYKENELCIRTVFGGNLLENQVVGEDKVLCDIYVREHKFNGLKEYRRVVKYK